MYKRIIVALLLSVLCTVHAGFFSAKMPDSKVIEDAIANFGTVNPNASFNGAKCKFTSYRGDFKTEITNRYNKKINGEDWQFFEVKVQFIAKPGIGASESIRVFRVEYGYIQRGNRWERRGPENIDYCISEWKFAKTDPIDRSDARFPRAKEDNDEFLTGVKYDYKRQKIGAPYQTTSPSHPYEVGITLKENATGNDVVFTFRFSALTEAWEFSSKQTVNPR